MAQISGVFLGLYFAGVSIVVSTVYSQIPSDVRSLLLREKVGNAYINLVALLGALAVLILAKTALGFAPAVLNFALISFCGVSAIFSFVALGQRVFYFFDPAELGASLRDDIRLWIQASTPKKTGWKNPLFQASYQRQAEKALNTYRTIVDVVSAQASAGGSGAVQLGLFALDLYEYYSEPKNRIPSESFWFKRISRHPNWLVAYSTRLDMALSTGTPLFPDRVPDLMWFEDHLTAIFAKTFEAQLGRGATGDAAIFSERVSRVLSTVAKNLEIDSGSSLFESHGRSIRSHIAKLNEEGSDGTNLGDSALQIIEYHCIGLINMMLGLSDRTKSITGPSFTRSVDHIKWNRVQSIYSTNLPRGVVQKLETMLRPLEFERSVEGYLVSPAWHRRQIAATALLGIVSTGVGILLSEYEQTFAKESEEHLACDRSAVAAQFIQRGLEAFQKFLHHLGQIERCCNELYGLRRVDDGDCPVMGWEDLRDRVAKIRMRLVVALSKALQNLSAVPITTDHPDYFGHAYSVLAQECYEAMSTGNEHLFEAIFPLLFEVFPSASKRILTDIDGPGAAEFGTDPLKDILTLSGYAIIYGELDGKNFGQVAALVWDWYLDQHPQASSIVRLINDLVGESFRFLMTPTEAIRTKWITSLERGMQESGLLDDGVAHLVFGIGDPPRHHDSAIVRALSQTDHVFVDVRVVFLVCDLMERPEYKGLSPPSNAESFAYSLQRELSLNDSTQTSD